MKKWSAEELTFLREKYGSVSAGYIADRLGRRLNAIYRMADIIAVNQKNWSKEEKEALLAGKRVRPGVADKIQKCRLKKKGGDLSGAVLYKLTWRMVNLNCPNNLGWADKREIFEFLFLEVLEIRTQGLKKISSYAGKRIYREVKALGWRKKRVPGSAGKVKMIWDCREKTKGKNDGYYENL